MGPSKSQWYSQLVCTAMLDRSNGPLQTVQPALQLHRSASTGNPPVTPRGCFVRTNGDHTNLSTLLFSSQLCIFIQPRQFPSLPRLGESPLQDTPRQWPVYTLAPNPSTSTFTTALMFEGQTDTNAFCVLLQCRNAASQARLGFAVHLGQLQPV